MKNKFESLEMELDKPNWKQWLPVYGIYQVNKDLFDDKPTIIDREDSASWYDSAAYQAVSIIATVYGLSQLAEKLF
jgi:hypothetical protein